MNTARKQQNYVRLLSREVPRDISTDKEYQDAMRMLAPLMMRHLHLSLGERKLYRSLIRLVASYEEKRFAFARDPVEPLEMLKFNMENHNHTAKDLWDVIADKGTISKILNGKRAISKAQAKRLGEFYHVSPAFFI